MSNIRIAVRNDLEGINSLISANKAEKNAIYRYPDTFDDYQKILPSEKQIVFVTVLNEIIIGFFSLHGKNIFENEGSAEFEVVIHPDYRDRKKHYGEKLLKYAIEYASHSTKITELVAKILKDNGASLSLCKKCGFEFEQSQLLEDMTDIKGYTLRLEINRISQC